MFSYWWNEHYNSPSPPSVCRDDGWAKFIRYVGGDEDVNPYALGWPVCTNYEKSAGYMERFRLFSMMHRTEGADVVGPTATTMTSYGQQHSERVTSLIGILDTMLKNEVFQSVAASSPRLLPSIGKLTQPLDVPYSARFVKPVLHLR